MPRRSLARPLTGPSTEEDQNLDHTLELQTRRSLARASLLPPNTRKSLADNLFNRSNTSTSSSVLAQTLTPEIFFNCLKLSAENKINAKNAFSLAMIDYLDYAVHRRDSPLVNFQLAGSSLDAGTKIYAARVDHVAGNLANLTMSMNMVHKKGARDEEGENGDDVGDEIENDQRPKKKKKAKVRSVVLARSAAELKLDLAKCVPKNKMFRSVGSLMDQSMDSYSFTFCQRARAVPGLSMSELETREKENKNPAVLVKLPEIPEDREMFPSLRDFKFSNKSGMESTRRSGALSPRKSHRSMARLTLMGQHLDLSLDEAAAVPFDDDDDGDFDQRTVLSQSFSQGTFQEACALAPGARNGDASVASSQFTCKLPENFVMPTNDRLMFGPHYWKFKRPARAACAAKSSQGTRKVVEDRAIDFAAAPRVDLIALAKRRAKTYLTRDTLMRWTKEKTMLPAEDFDDLAPEEGNTEHEFCIIDLGLIDGVKIAAPTLQEPALVDQSENVTYNYDNPADKQDYCPFPEEQIMPSDDEEPYDDEDEGEAMQNLFHMSDDFEGQDPGRVTQLFDESHLMPLPANVVPTVAPVWKISRGVNMRQLEGLIWKQIDVGETEAEKLRGRWQFSKLREDLPPKMKQKASVTSTLYALLNQANKQGLELRANKSFTDITITRLRVEEPKKKQTRLHPALLQ